MGLEKTNLFPQCKLSKGQAEKKPNRSNGQAQERPQYFQRASNAAHKFITHKLILIPTGDKAENPNLVEILNTK